jgi:RNA polymerase sigma factor (sigma-70 family)
MDVEALTRQAKHGDLDAFGELTRRFQHMAFGYALSFVRDLQHAEDIVQEAFVAAWFSLSTLEDPAAFPGWLRGIIRHHAHRQLRRRPPESRPLMEADGMFSVEASPERRMERQQRYGAVLAAVGALPRPLREVVTLFYVHDCSQQDIATFLGVPVSTVNNRLHAARAQLKRRKLTMVKDTLDSHPLPDDFAARIGRIVRARERVIEARFDPAALPGVLTELTVSDEAGQRAISVQVIQRLPDGVVRAVATAPIEGFAPGMSVLSEGRHVRTPLNRVGFERIVQLLAYPAPDGDGGARLHETGIKVIDVMSPLVAGGTVAVAGEYRAGTMVVVEELARRLGAGTHRLSIFALVPGPMTTSFEEVWEKEGHSGGTVGPLQTFYFLREEGPWTSEEISALRGVDSVIRLSTALAQLGIYPPVDPLSSGSRLLDARLVEREHLEIATRAREALALLDLPPDDPLPEAGERMRARARKLQRFFAQPFFVAEPYTRRPGLQVSRADALRGCRAILDGEVDEVPEKAFYFTGTLDDVLKAAAALPPAASEAPSPARPG